MTDWRPPAVEALIAEVARETGTEPTVQRVTRALWRVTIENDRVKNVLDFKQTPGGRFVTGKSTLWVDGQERPLCKTHAEFYDLFLNTADVLARENAKDSDPVDLPAMPPIVEDYSAAPHDIRGLIGIMARTARQQDLELTVGAAELVWVVQVEGDSNDRHLLIRFTNEYVNGAWYTSAPVIVVDGRQAALGDLDDALRQVLAQILSGRGIDRPSGSGPVAGVSAPKTTQNSVAVRNSTVFRI